MDFAVDWTTNVAERGAKSAKRTLATTTPALSMSRLTAGSGRDISRGTAEHPAARYVSRSG
jgi:hypothetical protein